MIELFIFTISCFVRDFDESLESHLSINGALTLGFFYNKNSNYIEYKEMLNRVIKYTEDFEIILVNCSKYLSVCIDKFADIIPCVKLYSPKGSQVVTMSLEISAYNIITFVTQRTRIKSKLPKSQILQINRLNYADFFHSGDYHIIEYIESNDQSSEMLDISYEEISQIYSKDEDIKFGRVNCSDDIDFCLEVGTDSVPIVRLYKNNETILFAGTREIPYILNFINENCNKHRSMNGENVFNFDSSFEEIINNFMKKPDKNKYINEIKSKRNGHSFSIIMNRIMKEGTSSISNMLNNLISLYNDPNVKGDSLINVEEKISILKLFKKYSPYVGETDL